MRGALGQTLRFFANISLFGWWTGGLLFHGYTIWVAYNFSGLLAAATTLCFPGLAQVFWAYTSWSEFGVIWSTFTVGLIAAFLVGALTFGLRALADMADRRRT